MARAKAASVSKTSAPSLSVSAFEDGRVTATLSTKGKLGSALVRIDTAKVPGMENATADERADCKVSGSSLVWGNGTELTFEDAFGSFN